MSDVFTLSTSTSQEISDIEMSIKEQEGALLRGERASSGAVDADVGRVETG